jgi:hypothetical protein
VSSYVKYYNARQIAYRSLASKWSNWAVTKDLTTEEAEGITKFFRHIAKRFGLIKEFRRIGVI